MKSPGRAARAILTAARCNRYATEGFFLLAGMPQFGNGQDSGGES